MGRLLRELAEVLGKWPLEEPDHLIEVSEKCTPQMLPATPEYSTMYHVLLRDASFWDFLFFGVDENLAAQARQQGCSCGERLYCANYRRKPRGGSTPLPEAYDYRLSFCCDRDGCRKRTTPPSVRFLGRRVFLGAVVVLVGAMRQGPSPRRVRELTELFGADRHTIARWCTFSGGIRVSALDPVPLPVQPLSRYSVG